MTTQLTLFPALFPALPGTQGARWFRLIAQGTCPYCAEPMQPVQAGRCVHASPCGHCLYEGRLEDAP